MFSEIEKNYFHLGVVRGGILFLPSSAAIQFIEECKRSKIEICGIDGFWLESSRTIPSMENSIDFTSALIDKTNIYERASAFIEAKDKEMYFEIIINL